MRHYFGIDLGTTNSAICSFDGETVRLYKSPDQNDVTPSAIFIDKRGKKYLGKRAYDNSARNPDNAAVLFKRLMGTSTPIKLPAAGLTMTPEECSAEVLRVLFGYLPEEIRKDSSAGTLITVPAAFNQMQKDATMSAAEMADIGKVALMQEPVAAVMSVMRQRKSDGVFLVYDLGGGTLDIAIAQSISGRVSLLSHGGIAMCGGRDFDRILLDNIVKPWLLEEFDLPENFTTDPKYKPLIRMATWVAEKAKIDLSSKEETTIGLSESELAVRDTKGQEIFLDIFIQRKNIDELIAPKIAESIQAVRETLEKAGLSSNDVERIVFVGGPTHYKPLRDKVAFELGIAPSTDVNPMTAVAEGAAVFAESIDWESQSHGRKSSKGAITAGKKTELSFTYISRTPSSKAKIAVKLNGNFLPGAEFQIDCLDTGWTSGRMQLKDGAIVKVGLSKPGDNTFKVFVFNTQSCLVNLPNDKIVITKTAASIDAIPSSSSIAIEVLTKVGGRPVLDYLIREGDPLPHKGKKTFKAAESLRAGSTGALNIKIWEGQIEDPICDNRFIGSLSINGSDFDDAVIPAGADLVCEYEILDSGNIILEVSVPTIGGTFHSGRNFYSRQEGQIDFTSASKQILSDVEKLRERVQKLSSKVDNDNLDQAMSKIDSAGSLNQGESDPEVCKQAMDNLLDAKKALAKVRKDHLSEIRQLDLDGCLELFNETVREHAQPTEVATFDNLARTAQRAIEKKSPDFEAYLDELKRKNLQILWRHDWFVVGQFEWFSERDYMFPDKRKFEELFQLGVQAIKLDDISKLRMIVSELYSIRVTLGSDADFVAATNILRG